MAKILASGLVLAAALTGPAEAAQFRVVVVPGLELADLRPLSERGAVGLLVPDAGPETSRERALTSLERGEVRNSLLGDDPPGEALLEAELAQGPPPGRVIVLGLPSGGMQPNDRRYPIAVLGPGYRGLLTSESTRIRGLVSIVDVAPTALDREGRLGARAVANPVAALIRLDDRIDANREAKAAVLLVSLALLVALAAFLPTAVLPGLAAILLANLALGIAGAREIWVDVLTIGLLVGAAAAFARLPLVAHGLLLTGVLAAYLVAMGVDDGWIALSPLGPTQNARFYGLSNLLATLLLVPALAGATVLGRRFGLWAFGAVAALALVTVGGSQFGADGGGVLVLLAGFGVLLAASYGWTRRAAIAAALAVGVLVLALALGGESHVTDALRDGPAGLAEDFWRRLELSWRRATSGWGVGLLVGGGIVALAVLALRERRPVLTAYLAALAVSLLVNDSPNDVIVAGLAGYLALSSAPGVARPTGEPARPAVPGRRAQSAPAASP
jgi:hypothetical protein